MTKLTSKSAPQCQYVCPRGTLCPNETHKDINDHVQKDCNQNDKEHDIHYCYWHDPTVNKATETIKSELEVYARNGGYTRGIILKQADLSHIDLVNHNHKVGYDFAYADFYRCQLTGGHLFNLNLHHASLMKADLRDANLNCANFKQANLLGVRWTGSKIENLRYGRKLKQEDLAYKALKSKDIEIAHDYFEQAEEIYRDLRKHAEHEGIFALSGRFIQKELTMRRMQLPAYSVKRIMSKMIDLFCGYGEAPLRIVGISIFLIFCCAFLYIFTGLNYQGEVLTYNSDASAMENFNLFLSCLYYSVVTFTTLGYGDFTPVGLSRAIAAGEAFTGSFTIALFVVVFVKKMTR